MLVDLGRDQISTGLPGTLPEWIEVDGSALRITGDGSLDRSVYVAPRSGRVLVATDLPALLDELPPDAVGVSQEGLSHMLGTGFPPLPMTIFDGIARLGAGDTLTMSVTDHASMTIHNDYPWLPSKSRQDSTPNIDHLLDLITSSLERKLDGHEGVLMMSSGVDSVTLAMAIAEMGYDIPCVTYQATEDDAEATHAASFCRTLGLSHQTITMPTDPAVVRRHLMSVFESAAVPSADHAMIPFIVTVAESGVEAGGIIDGSGNDGYMGYVTSKRRRLKSTFRIRSRRLQEMVARSTRIDSRLNYLARSRSAAAWPGRNMRYHEIRSVLSGAVDPADFWHAEDGRMAGWPDADRAVANMLRQIEGARTLEKVRLVADSHGMQPVLPYCDPEIADYFFHLPQSARYDLDSRTDKILLRRLLASRIDHDQTGVDDGFFAFDGASFFAANADLVRDEINSCDLWEPSVGPMVDSWLAAIESRPFLFHALLNLFAVSGWHNHSPYVAA